MDDFTKWTTGILIGIQILKMIFNWTIHNMINPKQSVEFGVNHPGMLFEKNGMNKAIERDQMFVYCTFILFWLKTPQKTSGKVMAWSVLGLSMIQIVGIILLINFGKSA